MPHSSICIALRLSSSLRTRPKATRPGARSVSPRSAAVRRSATMSTGAPTTLRERIGVDLGGRRRLEDGLAWAAAHGVHYVDMCLEGAPDHPNAPAAWTAERVAAIRTICERHRIHLGLHSASAVNVAETSPLLADAADQYLRTYIELAGRLGAGGIDVHGGYHFTGDYAARRAASLERLQRAAALAERGGARLLLENLNREPEHADVRHLAHNLEECREYLGPIPAPHLCWAVPADLGPKLPNGLQEDAAQIPDDNPITPEKVALGKKFFWDTRWSASGKVACVSCHRPDHGWSDPRRFSTDFAGKPTPRHAPTIVNRLFSDQQHWSGLRVSLEEQAGKDVNKTDRKVMEQLGTVPDYRR